MICETRPDCAGGERAQCAEALAGGADDGEWRLVGVGEAVEDGGAKLLGLAGAFGAAFVGQGVVAVEGDGDD